MSSLLGRGLAFDLLTLFQSGGGLTTYLLSLSPLAGYDYQDSSIWQDSARTTPSSSGDIVGAWDDLSGNGYHVLQATTANKPTLISTGVDFESASGQFLLLEDSGITTALSGNDKPFSVIAELTADAWTDTLFSLNNSATREIHAQRGITQERRPLNSASDAIATASGIGQHNIYVFTGTNLTLWANGAKTLDNVAFDTDALTVDTWIIGSRLNAGQLYLDGTIDRLFLFGRALTNDEIATINLFWGYS